MRRILLNALFLLLAVQSAGAGERNPYQLLPYQQFAFYKGAPVSIGGSCPVGGPTLPGLACDASGWTVINPVNTNTTACEGQSGSTPPCSPNATDSRIIYVSSSGTDSTTCGTFASPCATERYPYDNIIRGGSPDWVLVKCGDTIIDGGIGVWGKSSAGVSNSKPWVFGNYDGGNHVAIASLPADSPNCSARPIIGYDTSFAHGGDIWVSCCVAPTMNNIAIFGQDLYCYQRDPIYNNGQFLLSAAEASMGGVGLGVTSDGYLWEDMRVRFCSDNGFNGPGAYNYANHIYIRRSQFLNGYPAAPGGSNPSNVAFSPGPAPNMGVGISSVTNPVIYGSMFEHNSWIESGGINWAPQTSGFQHNIYTQDFGINGVDPASIESPFSIVDNIFSNNNVGGEQFRVAATTLNYNAFIKEPVGGPGSAEVPGSTISWSHNLYADTDNPLLTLSGSGSSCSNLQAGDTLTGGTSGAGGTLLQGTQCSGGSFSNVVVLMNPRTIRFLPGEVVSGTHGNMTISSVGENFAMTGLQLTSRGQDGVIKSLLSVPWTVADNYFVNEWSNLSSSNAAMSVGATGGDIGGQNNTTALGNVIFGFATASAVGGITNSQGGVTSGLTITTPGTGYTDNVATFTTTCSSSASTVSADAPTFTGSLSNPAITFTSQGGQWTATGTRNAANQITLSSVAGGIVTIGSAISGVGIPGGTTITSFISGSQGSNGVYGTSVDTTASSAAISGTGNEITITSASGYVAATQSGGLTQTSALSGTGVPGGTSIIAQISGTPNGNGVYQLNQNASWSSTTVTAAYQMFTLASSSAGSAFMLGAGLWAVTPSAVSFGSYNPFVLISGSQGANASTYYINTNGQPILTVSTQTFYQGCGNNDGQNYVVAQFSTPFTVNQGLGTEGNCFYQMTSGSDLTLHGPINCEISPSQFYGGQVNFFPSTWTGSTSGKLYWPWYNTQMSNFGVSSAHCTNGHYPTLDLTSVGGAIVGATFGGFDYSNTGAFNEPGQNCQNGDTLTAANGASCSTAPACGTNGFSFGAGSGLKITLNTVSSNTVPQNNSCNFATDNITDVTATNACTFTDPYRSVGSYVALNASAWGVSANASCTTGSITANVLTLSGCSGGAIAVNDAVTWAGQINAVMIVADLTHNSSLCGTPCTGNNGNGTYFVKGIANRASIAMSTWTSQQFLDRARNQFKGNFLTSLTPCKLLAYIKSGFGQSEACAF